MANIRILGCPKCSGNKSNTTHSYGAYRVCIHGTVLSLRCKTCGNTTKYRFIEGGI